MLKRKLKLLGIKNLEKKICLELPKVNNFHLFIMKFLNDLNFPEDEILKLDILFNEIWDSTFFLENKNYEVDLFVDEDYVFAVIRFPKKEKDRIMKIIEDNFFLPDKEHKDINIKIEEK